MVAHRFLHRSFAHLQIGDIIVSPAEQARRARPDLVGPELKDFTRRFSNWPCEFSPGQDDNVYFTMWGSHASREMFHYPDRDFTYIVEPLGPCEPDPEEGFTGKVGQYGSYRCERAKIVGQIGKNRQGVWEDCPLRWWPPEFWVASDAELNHRKADRP